MTKETEAIRLAASALSYGWIGHVEERSEIVSDGLRFYSGALQRLRRIVGHDDPISQRSETLATMELLTLYESRLLAGLLHSSGIETILRLRGPQMHIAGFDWQMFSFYRTVGILKALVTRKATFLSQKDWIHIPWTLQPKNTFHQFLDLAAEVPALLERADSLPASIDTALVSSEILDLLHQSADLIRRLKVWERSSGIRLPFGPPQHLPPASYNQARLEPLKHCYPSKSPQTLGTPFDPLQCTRLMLFYWAITLTLYTTIFENPVLSSLWVDFCSRNAWQSFGPAIAIFSLKVAIRWYRCLELLERLTFNGGVT
ncbi:hypothetical protein M432DRAFT_631176 [Thermoascus aurantiacus ATCC 26904]